MLLLLFLLIVEKLIADKKIPLTNLSEKQIVWLLSQCKLVASTFWLLSSDADTVWWSHASW